MKSNVGIISEYVKYPHGIGGRSKSISPRRYGNDDVQLTNSIMYFPERPPLSNQQRSIFNKAKEHLKKLDDIN